MSMLKLFVAMLCLMCTSVAWGYTHEIQLTPSNVAKVYDGDTIYVNLPGQLDVFGKEIGVRINGIDTPEIRSLCPTETGKVHERELATKARDYVSDLLGNAKVVTLKEIDRDKYFRLLAYVYADDLNVGDELVLSGLAKPYFGIGEKPDWCTQ